jgi:excisionase family DNA binding protein
MPKLFYSTSEVASLFRINRVTVYRWVKEGKVKAYNIGKHLKVPLSEVERLLKDFGFNDTVTEFLHDERENEEISSYINTMARYGDRKKLVIAVDDDRHALEMIEKLFKKRKLGEVCQLYTFSDSLEAAMHIGRGRPDLVLLGLTMPGLNGFELMQRIGEVHKKVKIVVMTGDPLVEKRKASEGVEIICNLVKPIALKELYQTIVDALH